MTDRKVALEEGQRLAQADREYKQSQKELEKKRRENTIVFSKQLQDLRDQTKERKIKRKEEDAVEAENIEAWVNRKANQTEMEEDARDQVVQLGENQLKISSDADAKIEEQIKQRMLERDIKSKKEEQEKLERKKKNHESCGSSSKTMSLRQVKERKQRQKEEDQKTLQEYMRVRDNTNAQREAQRQANLQEGKALQAFHKKQMEHNSNMRAKDKTERLVDAMARKEVAEAEEQALYEYMKQVGQEPWAVKNNRLQRFIGEELAARTRPRSASSQSSTGSSNGSQYGGNGRYVSTAGLSPASAGAAAAAANKKRAHQTHTSQRMGFTNDGWASMSRTNEIAAGNQLALIGEGLH
ncbi:hypothetical protein BC831DRAFT_514609 [Entophlyctis helioformis]|nr:hypothetical protein BC831DRAFT_514609 [Entophlyctis helioformis]